MYCSSLQFCATMSSPRDKLCDLLGCPRKCPFPELKQCFRQFALKHHPDKGGDPELMKQANNLMQQITDRGSTSGSSSGPQASTSRTPTPRGKRKTPSQTIPCTCGYCYSPGKIDEILKGMEDLGFPWSEINKTLFSNSLHELQDNCPAYTAFHNK